MPKINKSVKRKYGTRAEYDKIRAAQKAANKLFKKGVSKVNPANTEWRINKYGQAVPTSRALKRDLADWHEATHRGASIRKLTKSQEKALKEAYKNSGSEAPTIKNGKVLIGKGQSLFTKGGKPRIERSGTVQIGHRILMTDGWEDRVKKYARENPDAVILAKQTDLLDKFRSYQAFDMSDFGVANLIAFMAQYSDKGQSVTLLKDEQIKNQLRKNSEKWANYIKEQSRNRKKKYRAQKKKAGMRRGRGK